MTSVLEAAVQSVIIMLRYHDFALWSVEWILPLSHSFFSFAHYTTARKSSLEHCHFLRLVASPSTTPIFPGTGFETENVSVVALVSLPTVQRWFTCILGTDFHLSACVYMLWNITEGMYVNLQFICFRDRPPPQWSYICALWNNIESTCIYLWICSLYLLLLCPVFTRLVDVTGFLIEYLSFQLFMILAPSY